MRGCLALGLAGLEWPNDRYRLRSRSEAPGLSQTCRYASIAGIALLGPGIAAVVIAADLPVARRIRAEELDALQPFRALPEIEMRHHQPHRAAMFLLQRHARPAMHEQGVFRGKIFQRQIGGVTVMGIQHDMAGFIARLARIEQIAGRQPLPLIVVARPGGHAMDVGDQFGLRLRCEL
jgi:hypothetical protein